MNYIWEIIKQKAIGIKLKYTLQKRRQYLKEYEKYMKEPTEKNKEYFLAFERKCSLELWKLKEYRKFYHLN